MNHSPQLDLFTGATSEHSALVYARLSGVTSAPGAPGLKLRGTLIGPYCELSHTLPATVPFVDVGPGDEPLARALVPDPCCWSPDLPALYAAKLELVANGEVRETWERRIGIRRFAPRGRDLVFDQKRWVLRGVWHTSTSTSDLAEWRAASAAIVVDRPTDELCEAASRQGVIVVANARDDGVELENVLRRLAQWPAVVLCVVDGDLSPDTAPRQLAPNLTLAQRWPSDGAPPAIANWAEAIWLEIGDDVRSASARVQNCSLPVLACRCFAHDVELSRARAACDELQRDLAPFGDFAGYVINSQNPRGRGGSVAPLSPRADRRA